jgi:hypothetical protein
MVTACVLPACATSSGANEQAAVIVHANAQSRVALQRAVNSVFGTRPIALADDALTLDSTLIIEPVRPRDEEGRPLQGRETRAPEKLHLVKNGERCILIHERTGKRLTLPQTQCVSIHHQ